MGSIEPLLGGEQISTLKFVKKTKMSPTDEPPVEITKAQSIGKEKVEESNVEYLTRRTISALRAEPVTVPFSDFSYFLKPVCQEASQTIVSKTSSLHSYF